uniref:Hemocyanin 2 n=1 Tax=Thermobia domestica TaxID=89055 RepID=B3GW85_THEDO|nr:hemocyanin 2 [Thermobia domestica]
MADETFLKRQMLILKLLRHISEPLEDPELVQIKDSYSPLNSLSVYKDPQLVQKVVRKLENGQMLNRDNIFVLFDPVHRRQMIDVFEILYFANDYDTFFKTAVWLRDRMNPRQFLYAFSVALLHRKDCRGFTLPPAYEITPHMFLTTDVVRQAYQAKMTRTPKVIPMQFTGSVRNQEQRVAYFGEDIGMNSHHSHWHMDFPFWWKPEYGVEKDRKGELFYYMHHQLIARFDAERLSNYLPVVEPLDWEKPIVQGFAPGAMYENGQEFPVRPDNMNFHDLPWLTIEDMKGYEDRIRDAIASGFVISVDDSLVYLNDTRGIDVLGAVIESSEHSQNKELYGSLHNNAHVLLGKVTDYSLKYGLPPGVMEHFETATRDPAFFRLHKLVDNLFKEHKDLLPPYTKEDLAFPGVSIDAVKVVGTCKASTPNQLVTYFDEFNIDLANAVEGHYKEGDVQIKASVNRLNHEPFKYVITVHSDKVAEGIVRIFIAPKYDWFGEVVPLDKIRWSLIELDRFPVHLRQGDNVIVRSSQDSTVTIPEPRSYPELIKEIEDALNGQDEYAIDKYHRHCGYPHRLLLPKGTSGGMVFNLYVTITNYEQDKVHPGVTVDEVDNLTSLGYCGVLDGVIPDGRPMGYPYDRPIPDKEVFNIPNSKVIEVTIKNAK